MSKTTDIIDGALGANFPDEVANELEHFQPTGTC